MSELCHDCGQYEAEGCRQWCPNYTPPVIYHNSTPRARSTDPATSHHAADALTTESVSATKERILEAYGANGPMTDEELCLRLAVVYDRPVSVSSIRTRRSELVVAGLVFDTGDTRPTCTGRQAIVWSHRHA